MLMIHQETKTCAIVIIMRFVRVNNTQGESSVEVNNIMMLISQSGRMPLTIIFAL